MEGGISYADVEAAVPESANIISDPPRVLDMDLARRQVAALDDPVGAVLSDVTRPSGLRIRRESSITSA